MTMTEVSTDILLPFHLSICVNSLDDSRKFYGEILDLEERRSTPTSLHFNMYGSQLTLHGVPNYNARNTWREVDAENVPVPHFGFVLPTKESFFKTAGQLEKANVTFVKKPAIRFLGEVHEQYVLFVLDPAGNGIEIKAFVHAQPKQWL
jgi:extradiol dioxygenase family protein